MTEMCEEIKVIVNVTSKSRIGKNKTWGSIKKEIQLWLITQDNGILCLSTLAKDIELIVPALLFVFLRKLVYQLRVQSPLHFTDPLNLSILPLKYPNSYQ